MVAFSGHRDTVVGRAPSMLISEVPSSGHWLILRHLVSSCVVGVNGFPVAIARVERLHQDGARSRMATPIPTKCDGQNDDGQNDMAGTCLHLRSSVARVWVDDHCCAGCSHTEAALLQPAVGMLNVIGFGDE